MNKIRTTVSFDQDLHRQLSLQAASLNLSLSDLINRKISNKNYAKTGPSQNQIDADLAFFQKLAKKMGQTNWVSLVRKERERDK